MSKVNFFLKEPKLKDETLVYLFFSYNNQRLKYSTGEKIKPDYWSSESQRAKETKKFPEYPELNARLSFIQTQVNNAYRKILNDGEIPSNKLIKEELDKTVRFGEAKKEYDLFSFISKYIEECKPIKSSGTIKAYNTTFAKIKDYRTNIRKNFSFDDIDLEFYNSFIAYLIELDFSQNTIGKHIKVLKTFLNEATERGINKTVEFKKRRFKALSEITDKIYLNTEELERMYNLKLSNDKQLESIRDLFIIGCFTGLRFSDFSELKRDNIIDGNMIKIRTNKTNDLVIIPLHKYVREIIRKYNGNIPKALSNPKMNINLKHLGTLAKINEFVEVSITKGGKLVKNSVKKSSLICTHTARRSFATNTYLAGIPSITIMKMTGHTTEKSFLRYIRISQEENAKKLLDNPFFK
ncbi:MAG: site-specific integrase [Bacteroidales bacterium]|nr:site-specific integrase [Bacteroidales bacterium]